MVIKPKNWSDFQHYKDRSPSWIKLHKKLLDDYEFQMLPVASKALAPMLWLLASEYHDAEITATNKELAFRLRMTVKEFEEAVSHLIDSSFFECLQDDSKALAECLPREEKRREEKEKNDEAFDVFYKNYPKKKNKGKAEQAWKKVKPEQYQLIMDALANACSSDDWKKDDGKFIPYPSSWLNAKGWEDECITTESKPAYETFTPLSLMEQAQRDEEARRNG
jgi:hypothetical protein